MAVEPFPTVRACELEAGAAEAAWLIRDLWVDQGVGIIGGQPKLGKSWLGLDMAISVASGTPCLGRFAVERQGPALVFLAEDRDASVRARIDAICRHRRLDLRALDLHVLTAPVVRLDLEDHRSRLRENLARLRPRLLVLDPLVRMHRLDENSSAEISGLLGFIRELQRTFGVAVALVHHASKKHRRRPGQALRGSSDLHAFVDSLAYLTLNRAQLQLVLEHRSAPAPDPVPLRLRRSPHATHLEVVGGSPAREVEVSLEQRVEATLREAHEPMLRKDLRAQLRVNNQRLGEVLAALEQRGAAIRCPTGWSRPLVSASRQLSFGDSTPSGVGAGAPQR